METITIHPPQPPPSYVTVSPAKTTFTWAHVKRRINSTSPIVLLMVGLLLVGGLALGYELYRKQEQEAKKTEIRQAWKEIFGSVPKSAPPKPAPEPVVISMPPAEPKKPEYKKPKKLSSSSSSSSASSSASASLCRLSELLRECAHEREFKKTDSDRWAEEAQKEYETVQVNVTRQYGKYGGASVES